MATLTSDPVALRRYKEQSAQGFLSLNFEPGLEREYVADMRDRLNGSAQICGLLALAVWLGFAALDILRINKLPSGAIPQLDLALWFGARWLVVVLIVLSLIASRQRWRGYTWLAWASYVSLGVAAGLTGHLARIHGSFSADSAVLIIVMAAWLPMGFLFWRALAAALLITSSSIYMTFIALDDRLLSERLQVTLLLLLAVPLAAVGGYLREYADRRQFLLSSLRYRESLTDSLTGLPNRRHLYCEADIWFNRHKQSGQPWAMALLDLDSFKTFNDRFGHQAGDQALQSVAQALSSSLHPDEGFAARLGGEEFCLLLHGSRSDAAAIARAVQSAILALALPHPDAENGVLSASVGMAMADSPDATFDSLLRAADRALYAAKAHQRGSLQLGI